MRVFKKILLVFGMCFGVLTGAMPSYAQPVAIASDVPSFMPSQGWQVQPAEIAGIENLPNVKLPCLIKATYDNGYEIRLSGVTNKLLAMAIDFRQDAFTRGRQYPASLIVAESGAQKITATAFSSSVLVFNLRGLQNLYRLLPSISSFQLDVDGNVMRFATGSLSTAIDQLGSCAQGKAPLTQSAFKTKTPPSPVQPVASSVPPVASVPVSSAKQKKVMWSDGVPKTPNAVATNNRFKPAPVARRTWKAKSGDDLQKTLMGWGSKAGINIDWQARESAKVTRDVSVNGTFEEAVQLLMAQNATALGIEAAMHGKPEAASPVSLVPTMTDAGANATYKQQQVNVARWSADAGGSLQQVLHRWSENAGVEFSWQSHNGFKIKRSVSANGSYEAALQSLLSQYESDKIRPAAQLNNDPVSGQRFLFVQSARAL